MLQIPLTQGEKAIIDDSDIGLVKKFKWRLVVCRGKKYARTSRGRRGQVREIYMHRLLMQARPGQVVDHLNKNGLDNRRANLQLTTQSVNLHRKRSARGSLKGTWKIKGRKLKKPWTAQIRVNGKTKHLGYFETARLAKSAYIEASKKYYP